MTTPRVSATMLSARKHVEGRRGMLDMIPREARRPGARREEEAHGASARAGARRARQGGRGAGRVPQVRRDAPRVRGARRGRVAGAVPRVLRPRPLAQGHGPARVCPEPEGDVWAGRAPAPPGRGQPSPARSTARAPASRRPAGGPGRRRGCPGSRGARRRRARARHTGPRGVRALRGGRPRLFWFNKN